MANASSCTTDSDCGSVFHACNYDGLCGCPWIAAAEGDKCPYTSTVLAQCYLAIICIYVVVWTPLVCQQSYVTWLVIRRRKRGTVLKFAVLLEGAMAVCLVRECLRVAALVDVEGVYGSHATFAVVDQVDLVVAATCSSSAQLIQGLMWVEFIMASKRMASMGVDLQLSRKTLLATVGSYIFLATALTILLLTVTVMAFTIWLAVTALLMTGISVTFLYGSRKMSAAMQRMAHSLQEEITSQKSQLTRSTTDQPPRLIDHSSSSYELAASQQAHVDHLEEQARRFEEKAAAIVKCGRRAGGGVGLSIVCMVVWIVAYRMLAYQPVIWLFQTGIWLGFWVATHAMSTYGLHMLRGSKAISPAAPQPSTSFDHLSKEPREDRGGPARSTASIAGPRPFVDGPSRISECSEPTAAAS